MIEVQVPQEDDVDVLWGKPKFFKISRNSLILRHLRWFEHWTHGIEELRAQLRCGDLCIVASDIVENPTVGCLNQIRDNRRDYEEPLAAVPGRDDFLIALCAGQQRPHANGAG